MHNWKIKINNNEILNVNVDPCFDGEFCEKELKQIQKFYDKKSKKINFEEKVKSMIFAIKIEQN